MMRGRSLVNKFTWDRHDPFFSIQLKRDLFDSLYGELLKCIIESSTHYIGQVREYKNILNIRCGPCNLQK
jgi:hypothetical protein